MPLDCLACKALLGGLGCRDPGGGRRRQRCAVAGHAGRRGRRRRISGCPLDGSARSCQRGDQGGGVGYRHRGSHGRPAPRRRRRAAVRAGAAAAGARHGTRPWQRPATGRRSSDGPRPARPATDGRAATDGAQAGDPDRAQALLAEALDVFERLGARPSTDEAVAELARLDARPDARPATLAT